MDNLYNNLNFNIALQENGSMFITNNCGVIWLN